MNSEYFEVLNPGKQKKVFIVGDSHSQVIRYRFLQLYEQAKKQNKTSQFPTVIAMCRCGMPYYPCHPYFNSTFQYIKKHKPNRVLIVNHWYLWLNYAFKDGPLQKFSDCVSQFVNQNRQSYKDVALVVKTLKQTIRQIVNLGIQVHVATINPQGSVWNPRTMYDYNGIIQNNIKPISLSKFRSQNKQKIQMLQTAVKQGGGKVLDFSDNQCWQDMCELTTPYGHSVIRDNDHYRYDYARYWVTSVDYLTEFPQKAMKKKEQQNNIKPKPNVVPQVKPKPKPIHPQNKNNDLIPKEDDFFYKNGRKHVNSSKNKNRKKLSVDKLSSSITFQHTQCFPNRIQSNSPYNDNNVRANAQYFQVLNPGQQKKLFIVGDSHTQVIRFRFLQLFQQAKKQNKTSSFPTVIAMCRCGMPYYPCHPFFNTTFQYIKKHKPNRVLIVNHWYLWLHYALKDGPLQKFRNCYQQFVIQNRQSYKDVALVLKTLKQTIQQMVNLGIQVYVATINPQGTIWNPRNMFDYNGVIEKNIKPISLTKFRSQNKQKIQMLQTAVKQGGGKIIDFTDNQCWEGICQLTTPYGHSVMVDKDHFRYDYARYWVTSVDQLTQF